jgi:hypothetical protein
MNMIVHIRNRQRDTAVAASFSSLLSSHLALFTSSPPSPAILFSPSSGPAIGFFNGLHPKSKFLAIKFLAITPRCFIHLASLACCFLTFAAAAHAGGLTLTASGQGLFSLSSGSTGAAELSGITYAGGTSYYAVGDNGVKSIWQLSIAINPTNGRITSGSVTGAISAPGMGADSEGIALRPGGNSVWISDEVDSTITEFSLSNGSNAGSVTVPAIYNPSNVQGNRGLESLSYGAGKLWTANEEALVPDGSISTTSAGSWVRLQNFEGANFSALSQWAYRTDSISGTPTLGTGSIRSGLVDLLALPTGGILALEREFGGASFIPDFRSRIYEIDFTGSTDVTNFSNLNAGGFTSVSKTLLWQSDFASTNFEGMTLGPELDNGAYSLLLISDNGSGANGQRQDLYSFTLQGVPEPSTTLLSLAGIAAICLLRRRNA